MVLSGQLSVRLLLTTEAVFGRKRECLLIEKATVIVPVGDVGEGELGAGHEGEAGGGRRQEGRGQREVQGRQDRAGNQEVQGAF